MPKSCIRLLVVALVALTVPVQGLAAVVAGQCMAFGHHQDAGSDDHGHAQDGAHEHDQGAAHDDEGSAKTHCGPCTACCASASISAFGRLALPPAAANPPYLFSQLPPPGVQPHGLDRPPLAL